LDSSNHQVFVGVIAALYERESRPNSIVQYCKE
jgi:hypothetical protein